MKMPSQMFVAVTATLHRFILRLKMFRGKKFPCPAWGWMKSDFFIFLPRNETKYFSAKSLSQF